MIAATDYMRNYADQVRSHIPRRYVVLGTDGFGRSDYRVKLRKFFEVNRHYVAVAALKALADDGEIKPEVVAAGDQEVRARHRAAGSVDGVSHGAFQRVTKAVVPRRRDPASHGHDAGFPRARERRCQMNKRISRGRHGSSDRSESARTSAISRTCPVIEVMVKPGDTVKAEDALVTLESDKATMDVPAPVGGHGEGAQGQGRATR